MHKNKSLTKLNADAQFLFEGYLIRQKSTIDRETKRTLLAKFKEGMNSVNQSTAALRNAAATLPAIQGV